MLVGNTQLIPWCYLCYALASAAVTRLRDTRSKDASVAVLNVGAVFLIYFMLPGSRVLAFLAYMLAICACYLLTRLFASKDGSLPWLAFAAPIALLIGVRA